MDETGGDTGDFRGDLRAKKDDECGGPAHCLKHNQVLSSLLGAV